MAKKASLPVRLKKWARQTAQKVIISHINNYVACQKWGTPLIANSPDGPYRDKRGQVPFLGLPGLRTVALVRGVRTKNWKVETAQSYLGMLRHGNSQKLVGKIKNGILTSYE